MYIKLKSSMLTLQDCWYELKISCSTSGEDGTEVVFILGVLLLLIRLWSLEFFFFRWKPLWRWGDGFDKRAIVSWWSREVMWQAVSSFRLHRSPAKDYVLHFNSAPRSVTLKKVFIHLGNWKGCAFLLSAVTVPTLSPQQMSQFLLPWMNKMFWLIFL